MKRGIVTAACGVCLIAVCVGLAMPSARPTIRHTASKRISIDACGLLRTIGLPGDQLLAAGFSTSQVATAGQSLAQNVGQVDAFVALRQQVEQLQEQRLSLTQDQTDSHASELQQIDAQLAPLRGQLDTNRSQLRGLVLNGASDEQRQALARVAIGVRHGLPLELAVAAESDTSAVNLAVALKAESRFSRTGEMRAAASSLLSQARARPDVGAAAQNVANWATLRQSLSQTSTGIDGR